MLSYAESGFVVLAALVLSACVVAVLNRVWPISHRKLVNDVTGWQLGILGTTYGVILGFMLATVWEDFHAADVGVYLEASSLMDVSRIASGLPVAERDSMQKLAIEYAEAAIHQEWPAMQQQQTNHASEDIANRMWKIVTTLRSEDNGPDQVVRDHMTRTLSDLSMRRNLRSQEHTVRLPTVLWVLLVTGAVVTVGSACLLGNDNKWLHYCQVLALTFVVTVALSAIADLARPFEGSTAVTPAAFERVLEVMQESTARASVRP
jgi:hypothetical protein